MGRLAQWESACLTRKRSLVQTQCRPPIAAPSSSGLGRSPLKAEIAGSNPAGATTSTRSAGLRLADASGACRPGLRRLADAKGT